MKASVDCETASSAQTPDMETLQAKVVDCRREKVFLRELHYLSRKCAVLKRILNYFNQVTYQETYFTPYNRQYWAQLETRVSCHAADFGYQLSHFRRLYSVYIVTPAVSRSAGNGTADTAVFQQTSVSNWPRYCRFHYGYVS